MRYASVHRALRVAVDVKACKGVMAREQKFTVIASEILVYSGRTACRSAAQRVCAGVC
jgi:hypothetical protein